MEAFHKSGFPSIRLCDEFFEIKAIDYWEFRKFLYSEVVTIKYWKESDNGNWALFGSIQMIYANTDTFKLKIIKDNGGDWTYETKSKTSDPEFEAILMQIKKRCGIDPL